MPFTGLLSLPQDVLQQIADRLPSGEWAKAATACKPLHRVSLRTLRVAPRTKWSDDSWEFNKTSVLSALKWLAHHSASAKSVGITLHAHTLHAVDLPVAGLHWPELRAASISLMANYESDRELAREWLHLLLCSAERLQALSLCKIFDRVPAFSSLKYLCMTLPYQEATAPTWNVASFAASVTALPQLETLELCSYDADYFDPSVGGLDLSQCPKLVQVRLGMVGPASLTLPERCKLQLEMPAVWLYDTEDEDIEALAPVWQACAARIVRLRCTDSCETCTGNDELMDMLERFTYLHHLAVEYARRCSTDIGVRRVLLLDSGVCRSLANLTVLELTFQCFYDWSTSLVIPAAWRLKKLVVAESKESFGQYVPQLSFEDPESAAQGLEDVFVPDPHLSAAHALLMGDAFRARGLMMSAAERAGCVRYVYLKRLAAGSSSLHTLRDKYACPKKLRLRDVLEVRPEQHAPEVLAFLLP